MGLRCLVGLLLLGTGAAVIAQDTVRYAGIEIGAGGIKAITIARNGPKGGNWLVDERRPKDFDAHLGSVPYGIVAAEFSDQVVTDILNAVALIFSRIPHDVPAENRFVVISSGVVASAERIQKTETISRLASLIEQKIGIVPDRIALAQEVKCAFDDVTSNLPLSKRDGSLLIDIGSGNTKFGTYKNGTFVHGGISRGIGSELMHFRGATTRGDVIRVIELLKPVVTSELLKERQSAGLEEFKPEFVYLLGGAFFSLLGHCQPGDLVNDRENNLEPSFASLNTASVGSYRDWVIDGSTRPADFSSLAGDHRLKAEAKAALAYKVVPIDQRKAAVVLVESVFEAFDLNDPQPAGALRFPIDGQYAWIRGYLASKATK